MRRVLMPAVSVVCLLPLLLRGADPNAQQPNAKGLVVRTYDVSDLLRMERDYPLAGAPAPSHGGGGGGPPGLFGGGMEGPGLEPGIAPGGAAVSGDRITV